MEVSCSSVLKGKDVHFRSIMPVQLKSIGGVVLMGVNGC